MTKQILLDKFKISFEVYVKMTENLIVDHPNNAIKVALRLGHI
jgi:hypothetical protein